jgi:protein-S-isoprenylcysteine O-methyltransferase Ste14
MAALALSIFLIWMLVTFIGKSVAMKRKTGFSGFHGMSDDEAPIARLAGGLIIIGTIGALIAPILELVGAIGPFVSMTDDWIGWVGLALTLVGAIVSLVAQAAMGESWRIGVDPGERTELVTDGLFRWSRNPFFGAVYVFALGLFLMVPNPVSVVAGLCLFIGFEIQVRVVEEPNLRAVFGEEYEGYGRRVGRFAPGIGRFG